MLDELLVVDYRYARFALDPRTGLFGMIRSVSVLGITDVELTGPCVGIGEIQHGLAYDLFRTVWIRQLRSNDSRSLG